MESTDAVVPHRRDSATTLDERTRALKERIYATFTGLSILAAIAAAGHSTAPEALLAVAVGVLGISAAGFLAEVVAHQVEHQRLPVASDVRVMGRIAFGALGSASAPVILLALAWAGVLPLEWALNIGIGIYAATIVGIMLLATKRSGLRPLQRLMSSAMLLGLAVVVIGVLLLAHA